MWSLQHSLSDARGENLGPTTWVRADFCACFARNGRGHLNAFICSMVCFPMLFTENNGICGVSCFCTKQSCSGERHEVGKGAGFVLTRFASAGNVRFVWGFAHRLSCSSRLCLAGDPPNPALPQSILVRTVITFCSHAMHLDDSYACCLLADAPSSTSPCTCTTIPAPVCSYPESCQVI